MSRRSFVRYGLSAAAVGALAAGRWPRVTELVAAEVQHAGAGRPAAATAALRPFNMVALGDSIVWGQGLRQPSKFTWQIRDWLLQQMPGRPVNLYGYARSGATIAPDGTHVQPWMRDLALGEVPCSYPWIQEQLYMALLDLASKGITPGEVDLVLLDGGINDVNVRTILNPTVGAERVGAITTEKIRGPMENLLSQVLGRFPGAKVLVTGYFPIVSAMSDLTAVAALVAFLFGPGVVVTPLVKSKLVEQSDAWHRAATAALGGAVEAAGRGRLHMAPGTAPAVFVPIPWGPQHSYAAPESLLWLVGVPVDEVWDTRQAMCTRTGKAGDPFCRDAKMSHPNPAGARAYAGACISRLKAYLPEWRGLKVMTACVEFDALPAPGVAATVMVHAVEKGGSGATVAGTVRVGQVTFPTDTPVSVTLCTLQQEAETDTVGGKPVTIRRETVTTCAPMLVSAPGFVDVVIENYLDPKPMP